jgi:hypothetical protein
MESAEDIEFDRRASLMALLVGVAGALGMLFLAGAAGGLAMWYALEHWR